MYNRVILIGNLGDAPVIREGTNGRPWAAFRLATSKVWYDSDNQVHEETEWHSCTLSRDNLDSFAERVGKGTGLFVEGELHYRFDEQDGVRRQWATVRVKTYRVTARPANGGAESPSGDAEPDEAEEAAE